MPYIPQKDRNNVLQRDFRTAGELNYFITCACLDYMMLDATDEWDVGYTTYNEIIGVLECAKQEFYRRMVAKYEDNKCTINGDVFK